MKNSVQSFQYESSAQLQARKAIQRIQQWVEEQYPSLTSNHKTKLILECLIEMDAERKYIAAQ
jgi:hypothetical protein